MAKKKIRIVILALSLSILIGCTNFNGQNSGDNLDNGNKVEQGQNEDTKTDDKEIIDQLKEIVKNKAKLPEAFKYLDVNISKVTKDDSTQMVEIFEKAQKDYLATLDNKYYNEETQERFQSLNKSIEDINDLKDIEDESIKELVTEAKSLGYKVETVEASYFPIIDYSFFKKYSNYVTDDMKEYIEIMSTESDEAPAKDAGLVVTWDEFLNRTLTQEKFINEYKDSAKLDDIKELYNRYVYFIFNGLANTPLFDYNTNTMVSEAKNAYLVAIESKESALLEELRGYMNALKGTDYKLTDDIIKYGEEAIDRLSYDN
ncbi:MAG: hypothetical protein WDA24_05635 [Tissierellales bacterium]